jgi:uncharacterized protein YqeY
MTISERLNNDMKNAMKAKDEIRLGVLRMLKSDLKYKQIEFGHELTEEEVIAVLSTAAKTRRDAIEEYERGGRNDLRDQEKAELEIVIQYLPEQLSAEELGRLVDEAIAEAKAVAPKDIGAVMKVLMPKVRGRADGKAVNVAVRARLEGK